MSAESEYVEALLSHGLVIDADRKLLEEALKAELPHVDLETNVHVEAALRLGGVTDGKRWRLLLPPDRATLEAVRDWLWTRGERSWSSTDEPRSLRNARIVEAAAAAAGLQLRPRSPLTIPQGGSRGGFRNFGYAELRDVTEDHTAKHDEKEWERCGQPNGVLGEQYMETIVVPLTDEDSRRLGLPVPSHLTVGICPICGRTEKVGTVIGRAKDVSTVWPLQYPCPASCGAHRHSWTHVKAPIVRDPAFRDTEKTVGSVSLDVCLVPVSHPKTNHYIFTHVCGAGRNVKVRANAEASSKQWMPKKFVPGPYADDSEHIHAWRQPSGGGPAEMGTMECLTCDGRGVYKVFS